MRIVHPSDDRIPALRELWKKAFGDEDAFLDLFFRTAYSPQRCRCVLKEDRIAAALYWFDCSVENQKTAYIYAVATDPAFREQGLCRALMSDTHELLRSRNYASSVLVPQKEGLRAMYSSMGYRDAGGQTIFSCEAGSRSTEVRVIGPEEFAAARRELLPPKSIIQEGENLPFLAAQMTFFRSPGCLMAAWREKDTLHTAEYLGDPDAAPGILKALGFSRGDFRMPGDNPFAMWHSLQADAQKPEYFGFAFD